MNCPLRIWPTSSSEIAKRIRLKDWSNTVLGELDSWPDALRYAITLALNQPTPMIILWGEQLVMFYNDACIPLLADRHPYALGQPLKLSLPDQYLLHQNICQTVQTQHLDITLQQHSFAISPDASSLYNLTYTPLETLQGVTQGVLITISEQTSPLKDTVPPFISLEEPVPKEHLLQEGVNLTRWETDANSNCIFESVSWQVYTAQSKHQARGKGWLNAIHPKDRAMVLQCWQSAAVEKRPVGFEVRIKRYGQQWAWNALYALPVLNDSGEIERWMGMTIDVSVQKRADETRRQTDALYRIAVEASGIGTWQIDLETMTAFGSARLLKMMGIPQGKNVYPAKEWQHYVLEPDRPVIWEALQKTATKGLPYDCYFRVRMADGSIHWLHGRGEVYTDAVRSKKLLIGATVDITQQRHTEEELLLANRNLNLVLSGAGEAVWEYEPQAQRLLNSPELNTILGYPDKKPVWDREKWHRQIHPEDLPRVRDAMQDALTGKVAPFCQEYRVRTPDGRWKWVLSRGSVVERDDQGNPVRMIGMISDISARKEADEQIWRLANLCSLTSLPNRRLFKDRLVHAVLSAHRHKRQVALMFVDLDQFKAVNDVYGHDAGDNLLLQAAARLLKSVRDTDTVARLGGDEFTIILEDLQDDKVVEQIAQKVIDALAKPFNLGGNEEAYVSGSVGIALYPNDARSPEELIRKADQAMYAAKRAGKNQFSYFTRDMDEQAHARMKMIKELRRSFNPNELILVLQPIVDMRTQRIIKAEALLRWKHPVLGEVSPEQFLPLAKEAGLLAELGDYVFKIATRLARQLSKKTTQPIQISINSSPGQFSMRYKDKWLAQLRRQKMPAHTLALEVGESLLSDDQVTLKRLQAYHEAGMDMAVDNFGSGMSSLSHLVEYPVDYLKIDRSFTRDMVDNAKHRAIVESTIAMAHRLGLPVSAAGVETEDQYRLLQQAGCDYAQGYFFSHPLPPEAFTQLVMLNQAGNWPRLPH